MTRDIVLAGTKKFKLLLMLLDLIRKYAVMVLTSKTNGML